MKKLRVMILTHAYMLPPDDLKDRNDPRIESYRTEFDVREALNKLGHEVILVGLSDEEMTNSNMVKIFGTSFVLTLLMGLVLASFHPQSYGEGIWMGGFLGIGVIATSFGVNYLFQRQSFALWFIDAGYQVVVLLVMGLIIGAWQ